MIELAAPLLLLALCCYVGARFALLANWKFVAGAARLLGMWAAACWLDYSTPLYVAIAMLALGFVWARLARRLKFLLPFELALLAALVWHSATPPVVIYLVGLVLFDQLLARLLLLRFDRQLEPRENMHRLLVVGGVVAALLVGTHFYLRPLNLYLDSHGLTTAFQLVPQGAPILWLKQRELLGPEARDAVAGSVYWEARFAADTTHCVLAFHGAARPGSLQPVARAVARGVRQSGLRYFAIDHPGYGASPTPASGAPVDAWDPALLTSAVLARMRVANCQDIHVLGHSQGVTEALRLLTNNNPAIAEVLALGAGLYSPSPEREAYWHERFHIDRGLSFAHPTLELAQWKLVRDLYYLNQEYCADTPTGKNYRAFRPLNFVQFADEHANLVATRDELYNCLDYPEKQRSVLPTNHYLDALQLGSLMLVPRTSPALIAALLPTPQTLANAAEASIEL